MARRGRRGSSSLTMMRGQTYFGYQKSLENDLWLRFNETSGNPIQYGTVAGLTITQTACAQGQTGIRGEPNEAYGFDGATSNGSIVSIANDATLKAMTTQRWMAAVRLESLGAGGSSKLVLWGAQGSTDHLPFGLVTLNSRIQAFISTNGTNAAATSNNNEIADLINNPGLLFMDYDDNDDLGNGRKIRLFKAVGGVVSQISLATDTAAVGTVDQPNTPLCIGNRSVRDLTVDGLIDEITAKANALWTLEEMQLLADFFS